MYVGFTSCMWAPHHVWVPHHVSGIRYQILLVSELEHEPEVVAFTAPGAAVLPPAALVPDATAALVVLYGPLRGHGFDMGMIFGDRPHARRRASLLS